MWVELHIINAWNIKKHRVQSMCKDITMRWTLYTIEIIVRFAFLCETQIILLIQQYQWHDAQQTQ